MLTSQLRLVPLIVLAALLTSCSTPSEPRDEPFADGTLPDNATVYDEYPGITRLDPHLLDAVRNAADDAAEEGVEFIVNSGWRSESLQAQLFEEAVDEYGSVSEASRWVATPRGSSHVSGDAVDIGDWVAAAWLQTNGARYDLCQTFDNEAWHFELRPGASIDGCPPKYYDATDDPRNAG
ncbi:D-alanyl-D-alanine carboxypeptidase [Pseudoclavibacter endophyticus]|uniref:M15 family metallopeptidase n=1 Tax=Pseudoclavibacter endophyticus TaxID=1778590 RepID=A0A6H9WLL5_9MICO|nr:M15 family metallopeptidase [Pseudoclavibacter endophyticus]KAB1649716.1 M15 family metallopeptidase [Pseudoclavibacter endophyticus]GGA60315.1 D-alanyl-D-alanine carboxypeptidase [Pseudoclavibacter endophyticus]